LFSVFGFGVALKQCFRFNLLAPKARFTFEPGAAPQDPNCGADNQALKARFSRLDVFSDSRQTGFRRESRFQR
jgi:hypothetical protein